MKIRLGKGNRLGSVLFITLVLAGLLGVALGSYLYWVRSQNLLTTESHAWNGALVVAEAGVEEALAQINTKFGTNGNFAANGWGGPSSGTYGPVSRTIKSGLTTNGSYSAIIQKDPGNGYPIVYSTGYTTVPLVGRLITRVVKVETTTSPAFAGAMAALNNISFKGNQISIDSYDSMSGGLYSTSTGMYDPAKRKAGGDIASTDGIINIQNANIMGTLPNLVLADGTATTASVVWNSPSMGMNPGEWMVGFADMSGNTRMMNGYLDPVAVSMPAVVTVSGLPASITAAGYDVYVYVTGDVGTGTSTRTYNYAIGTTMFTVSQTGPAPTSFTSFTLAPAGGAGNYIVFRNLTAATFTLTATPGTGTNVRAPVNGLQIVAPAGS